MSQTKVTSYYNTRKTVRSPRKKAINSELLKIHSEDFPEPNIQTIKRRTAKSENKAKLETKLTQDFTVLKEDKKKCQVKTENINEVSKTRDAKRKPVKFVSKTTKVSKKNSKAATTSSALLSQSKVTSFYCNTPNTKNDDTKSTLDVCIENFSNVSAPQSLAPIEENKLKSEEKTKCEQSEEITESCCKNDNAVLFSPKRNLTNPCEGTPPKKRSLESNNNVHQASLTLVKSDEICKKLIISDDDNDTEESVESNKKKVVQKNISEETQKAVSIFKEKLAKIRNYEANPCKVTSVISSSKEVCKTSALPSVPAYQRYSYLVDPEASSSLILPFKYKLLSEMFRSMDTVVSMLNNRKERITFEKVKEGIQKMMKRNFSKVHLGQIVKVMPAAYNVTLEKNTYKKANDPDYHLIISPSLAVNEGISKKTKSTGNVNMTPQMLLDRKHEFNQRLLDLVKIHHSRFLLRLNFPPVPEKSIKRWHPKFPVDSVPDVEVAELPKIPEVKVCTAKDVLNKIVKGSVHNKVVNALKSVVEETSTPKIETEPNSNKPKTQTTKSALKGVCADLLAKVRARESAKLLECMTESPEEVKKKAMLERLPKIIQILWHYFIAERKAAVPVDTAVDKIIYSFNSLLTYDEVKAHLALITETFPGWLSFIQIPKGLYITMDKNKNISEMLDKLRS